MDQIPPPAWKCGLAKGGGGGGGVLPTSFKTDTQQPFFTALFISSSFYIFISFLTFIFNVVHK